MISIEWLNAFADLKKPGTVCRELCFHNDERPELSLHLPDNGLDIQHAPGL